MPRKVKHVSVYVALSPTMLAAAFGVAPRHIYEAITAGHLEVRQLPGTMARRIFIGPADTPGTAEHWYRNHWLPAKPKQGKDADHGG